MESSASDPTSPDAQPFQYFRLPIHRIYTSPHQMRRSFDEGALKDLAESMRQEGLLQPITVRPVGDAYELVAGERRWRAAQLLGWTTIDARVLPTNDPSCAVKGLIENLQRADLNPIEEAMSYRQLMAAPYHMTPQAISDRVGRSPAAVARVLGLLELPHEVQQMLANRSISETHGRALRRLPERSPQIALARQAEIEGWTTKELERRVDQWLKFHGRPLDRRQTDRRRGTILSVDPLHEAWASARTSMNGNAKRWNVQYRGNKRWSLDIHGGELPTAQALADVLTELGKALREQGASLSDPKKRAKKP